MNSPELVDVAAPTDECCGKAALRLWTLVRDEGGWWTSSELAVRLMAPRESVQKYVRSLVRHQYLAERLHPVNGLRRVGVTALCCPPRGESMEPGRAPESWGA